MVLHYLSSYLIDEYCILVLGSVIFIPRPEVVVGDEVVESVGTEAVVDIDEVEGETVPESDIVESNVNWK